MSGLNFQPHCRVSFPPLAGWNCTTTPAMRNGATICSATQTVVPWSVLPAQVWCVHAMLASLPGCKVACLTAGPSVAPQPPVSLAVPCCAPCLLCHVLQVVYCNESAAEFGPGNKGARTRSAGCLPVMWQHMRTCLCSSMPTCKQAAPLDMPAQAKAIKPLTDRLTAALLSAPCRPPLCGGPLLPERPPAGRRGALPGRAARRRLRLVSRRSSGGFARLLLGWGRVPAGEERI